ncbi:hypothetical protein EMIT0357P_20607 [Pseudomonas marginalis]
MPSGTNPAPMIAMVHRSRRREREVAEPDTRFNIIYIMRNTMLRNEGQCPSDSNRQNPSLAQT